MGKKIWLSIHPRIFDSDVTVRTSTRPSIPPQGNQCEMTFITLCGDSNLCLTCLFHRKAQYNGILEVNAIRHS